MKGVCAALLVASTVACPTSFELWWKFSWEKHERRASTTLWLPSVQLMSPSWFNTLDTVPTFSCVWHYIRILKRQIPSVKINSFKLQALLKWQIKESNFFGARFWFLKVTLGFCYVHVYFHHDLNLYNLGLCIFSWGLGAEMMYSSNFGFWSSVSFFSPDDITSGFTGWGGFSLLWGPFVQPCERKERQKSMHGIHKNNEQSGPICWQCGQQSMPLKATASRSITMED